MASGDVRTANNSEYNYKYSPSLKQVKSQSPKVTPDDTVVDALPTTNFNVCDTCLFFASSVFYLFDVVTDVLLASFYYYNEHYIYFGLTLCFIILPSVVTNILSIKWYLDDRKRENIPKVSIFVWIVRIMAHLCLLGVLYRFIESQYYGWKSIRRATTRTYYYSLMVALDADSSLLRLFEAFLESAPQLVLQLYVLATNALVIRNHFETGFYPGIPKRDQGGSVSVIAEDDPFRGTGPKVTVAVQVVSVIASLLSISSSLTSYARNQRFCQKNKKNMSWTGTIFHFLWHLGTLGARVLAVALFASAFTYWCAVAICLRWLIMTSCLWSCSNAPGKNSMHDIFMNMLLGLVYIFTFLNPRDEPTLCSYVMYYILEIIEDTTLIGLWSWVVDPGTAWFYWPAIGGHFGAAFAGLICMAVYYMYFHPNGPKEDLFIFLKNRISKSSEHTTDSARFNQSKKLHRASVSDVFENQM